MFTHHKLKVYGKALAFFGAADGWLPKWGHRVSTEPIRARAGEALSP
jgi:hypothetical protein